MNPLPIGTILEFVSIPSPWYYVVIESWIEACSAPECHGAHIKIRIQRVNEDGAALDPYWHSEIIWPAPSFRAVPPDHPIAKGWRRYALQERLHGRGPCNGK